MKTVYKYSIFIFLSTFLFSACEGDDTSDVSQITYYPIMELLGDKFMPVEANTTFDDPGINATVNGEEVPYEVSGEVDTSTPGTYTLSYVVTNEEGISASLSRIVYVYENDGSIAGFWYGSSTSGSGFPVLITTTGDPNVYNITDVLVGHYEYGAGYGPAYAVPSTINYDGSTISSPGGDNAFGTWTVDGPSIASDEKSMTWGATLVGEGFSLSGLELEKVTP